jgi:hypothetical protein
MTRSEWWKDIEYVVDWDANLEELGQNFFDGPLDFPGVLVKLVLIVVEWREGRMPLNNLQHPREKGNRQASRSLFRLL